MTKLTPDEAHYVLRALMSQGKLRASQIGQALRNRDQEIRSLRERLASLVSLSGGSAGNRRGGRAAKSSGTDSAPRRRRMSPKVRALRRLQGQYMGLVRGLKAAEKARVRTVREKKGMHAAIRLARSLGPKR